MKSIIIDQLSAEQIEMNAEIKKQQEWKLLGDYTPKIDGGTIFEYNRETREFKPAQFRTSDLFVIGSANRPKLYTKKGMIYVEALNISNAAKRLRRGDIILKT